MQILNNCLRRAQKGDTIIEVLIALAVLGLAFGFSYATANQSLVKAQNAEEHSEALQYLDSQVELARADNTDNNLYDTTRSLCMDPVTGDANFGKPIVANSPLCTINSLYQLSYVYAKAPANGTNQDVFTFTVTWPGLGTLGQQREQLNYKIHQPT